MVETGGVALVWYDATLILRHGSITPVGLVRAEHYVAEALWRDSSVELKFVVFDPEYSAYRQVTRAEQTNLINVLTRRYIGAISEDVEAPDASRPPMNFKDLARCFNECDPITFAIATAVSAGRILPIRPQDGLPRRVSVKIVRRSVLSFLRAGQKAVYRVRIVVTKLSEVATKLGRLSKKMASSRLSSPHRSFPKTIAPELEFHPSPGDSLICLANAWDYMDYRYLHNICHKKSLHLIGVIYDVIAMEFPATTPAAPHVYHRHWTEFGHLAHHLVCISRHTEQMFRELICKPNLLEVSTSVSYLPNFLMDRAKEIGETPSHGLLGRKFVLYCSTIEFRKNHQLLLQVWDRLTCETLPDELPILVFVGKWGWSTETVSLMVSRNWRLRSHLKILTEVEDHELIWLYRNAMFSVFPSVSEGFGLAVSESLSFGTPVLIANCPALVEASENLMPTLGPYDVDGWAEKIKILSTDETLLTDLRAKAAQYRGAKYYDFVEAIRAAVRVGGERNVGVLFQVSAGTSPLA